MKKTSTVRVNGNMIFKGHKLTIGLDLGDRWSFYCVMDEAGQVILEQKLATTAEAMKQTFARIPRSLIALETGTHSPWVSRRLGFGTQIINGVFAQGVRYTRTIPAGRIGNANPIKVITERWYSPDLQVVVKTMPSDPMSGQVTYTLNNIQRTEPAASLFTVPLGYTVTPATSNPGRRGHGGRGDGSGVA